MIEPNLQIWTLNLPITNFICFSARLLHEFLNVVCAQKMKLWVIGAAMRDMSASRARASPKAKRLCAARAREIAVRAAPLHHS